MKIATAPQSAVDIERPVLTLPFTVRIDNREQTPWRWSGIVGTSADAKTCRSKVAPRLIVPQVDKYMPTADYCIDLPDGECHVPV